MAAINFTCDSPTVSTGATWPYRRRADPSQLKNDSQFRNLWTPRQISFSVSSS